MMPDLKKAIELAEREQLLELSHQLRGIKTKTTNEHAAKGALRSGAFPQNLLSRQLEAITTFANALAEDYVRLAAKAGPISADDATWLRDRLAGLLTGKGLLDSARESHHIVRFPDGGTAFMQDAQRSIEDAPRGDQGAG
jgi:hypothetical protein